MKLSFSSLPCEGWSAERMASYCTRFGFSGIELRETSETWLSLHASQHERRRASEQFEEAGICVTNIGSSICYTGAPQENMPSVYKQAADYTQMALDFNAKAIRIFLGNFIRTYHDPKISINYEAIVERVRAACDIAGERNIEIWIETHNEFATGKVLRQLIDEVNRDNLGIIWDVMHPLEDGEQPETTISYLGKSCSHVHIKDGVPSADPSMHDWMYTEVGAGKIPIADIVARLRRANYKGFLSLEWETKWRTELQVSGMEPERVIPRFAEYMKAMTMAAHSNGEEPKS